MIKQFEWYFNLKEALQKLKEEWLRLPTLSEWIEILEDYQEKWNDYKQEWYLNNEIFVKDTTIKVLWYYSYKRKPEDPLYYKMPVYRSWIKQENRKMDIKKFILFWLW